MEGRGGVLAVRGTREGEGCGRVWGRLLRKASPPEKQQRHNSIVIIINVNKSAKRTRPKKKENIIKMGKYENEHEMILNTSSKYPCEYYP